MPTNAAAWDPCARGPHPAGVRTAQVRDAARDRPLALEVWYPAADAHAGRDLDPATRDEYELLPGLPRVAQDAVRDAAPRAGRFPVVAFSHGFAGHRRQSTHLCTHLASHGYVVVAVDHTGNTFLDLIPLVARFAGGGAAAATDAARPDLHALAAPLVAQRPADLAFAVDCLADGAAPALAELAACADTTRLGVAGHSFGGWTALALPAIDERVGAVLPLAPAGGSSPLVPGGAIPLRLDWKRAAPTLFVAAERDTLLPLDGVRELFARTPGDPKRLVVLRKADHMHFCDRIEETHELFRNMPIPVPQLAAVTAGIRPIGELCPPDAAYAALRGLALAHMDAWLKRHSPARQLLSGDPGLLSDFLYEGAPRSAAAT